MKPDLFKDAAHCLTIVGPIQPYVYEAYVQSQRALFHCVSIMRVSFSDCCSNYIAVDEQNVYILHEESHAYSNECIGVYSTSMIVEVRTSTFSLAVVYR